MTYSVAELVERTNLAFQEIGYKEELIREGYRFADFLSDSYLVREIPLAGFAHYPPSYRTSGFGVVISDAPNSENENFLSDFRALGAPHLLVINNRRQEVYHWELITGTPLFHETVKAENLVETIRGKRDEWGPESVLRSKVIGTTKTTRQLDFYDVGLLPVIEEQVNSKLDELFGRTLTAATEAYYSQNRQDMEPDAYQSLFRLVFRLVAAKLLADRDHPGTWIFRDVKETLSNVERFYFQAVPPEPLVLQEEIQQTVWDIIRRGFHLENLSLEALAYVYEHTFVTTETRIAYGTHATPPEIAEFVVDQLPLHDLSTSERRIFEPFTGHAPFLIAALGRLRSLLPSDLSSAERHRYFTSMLSGIELDSFAREIARYSLILADYPNPNGWRIESADAFNSQTFGRYLTQSSVVLCNPPFGDFTKEEFLRYPDLRSTRKPVQVLLQILDQPPEMIGLVLPRSFVDGRSYKEIRKKLADSYGTIRITALPENVFRFSRAETVVLTASDRDPDRTERNWFRAFVSREDYAHFRYTRCPSWEDNVTVVGEVGDSPRLWESPLERSLTSHLAGHIQLGTVAEIHRGIEYKARVREHVSEEPLPGYARGLQNVDDGLEPYFIDGFKYLDLDPNSMRGGSYKYEWRQPKVIANAARISSSTPWRIIAAPDQTGLYCYQRFHGLWPTRDISLELIAATLNGPIANALLSVSATSRDNLITNINKLPLPDLSPLDLELLVSHVRLYRHLRAGTELAQRRLFDSARPAMTLVDVVVLRGYKLPDWLIHNLFRYIGRQKRPRVGISFIEQLYELHSVLVDQKFLGKLPDTHLLLLDYVNYLLDIAERDFYRPIQEALTRAGEILFSGEGADNT